MTGTKRALKRALRVLGWARCCRRLLVIVRLIQAPSAVNLLASAAVREVTAAERFRRDFGWWQTLFDSDLRLQVLARWWVCNSGVLGVYLVFVSASASRILGQRVKIAGRRTV